MVLSPLLFLHNDNVLRSSLNAPSHESNRASDVHCVKWNVQRAPTRLTISFVEGNERSARKMSDVMNEMSSPQRMK